MAKTLSVACLLLCLAVATQCSSVQAYSWQQGGRQQPAQQGNQQQLPVQQGNRNNEATVKPADYDGLYKCGGAQQIGTSATDNMCCSLCFCIGNQSSGGMFAGPALQQLCRSRCANCVVAGNDAKQCPTKESPLPKACSSGLAFSPTVKALVDKCAGMYFKDPNSVNTVQGC